MKSHLSENTPQTLKRSCPSVTIKKNSAEHASRSRVAIPSIKNWQRGNPRTALLPHVKRPTNVADCNVPGLTPSET